MGNLDINIDDIQPTSSFELIPDGKYLAEVIASEVVPTKKGNGRILKLTFSILQGDYMGRKVFQNLNIENPSETAQAIALGQLSGLCRAVGKSGIVADSMELHEIPLYIDVRTEPAQGEYSAKNKVTNYTSSKKTTAAPTGEPNYNNDPLPF